ncbi:hypothetical protein F5I97DRAFT_1883224 [Phlebopus sp. FC_14]|nr:hypothetical protein F5I97DRAFT_1883224 [Phlebopus sp. FC_14]
MARPMDQSIASKILSDIEDDHYTVRVAFAGFTVLFWDHCITFDDEVNLIWNGNKGALVYLFLLNRYLTPLGFITNLVAFTLPSWGAEVCSIVLADCTRLSTSVFQTCRRSVRYEGALTTIGIQVVGLMMFLRIRAMYKENRLIIRGMACLFLIWVGVNAYLLTRGQALPHASGLHSCSMIFDESIKKFSPAAAWLPLLYDTAVFLLTLNKTMPSIRQKQAGHIVYTLFKDGLLYYSLICAVNLVLVIMISRASVGISMIAAQLELLFTVAMMSRITLNLRKQAMYGPTETESALNTIYPYSRDGTGSELSSANRRRSGSASSSKLNAFCLRAGLSASSQRHSADIRFARSPTLYAERFTLSTIFSASPTPIGMSPAAASPAREDVGLSWEIAGSTTSPAHKDIETS